MVRADIIKKVRSAVIRSRTVLSGTRSGIFKVHASGSGYDFDQLSEYYEGGDYRRIDWKSSARTNSLLLREYKDEQNRNIHVMVDVSPSMRYGTTELLVSDVAQELVQALKVLCEQAGDALFHHAVNPAELSWKVIFEQFGMRYRRRALLFIISDFIMEHERITETALSILARQHEVIIVRVRDVREAALFEFGASFICKDSELHQIVPDMTERGGSLIQAWRDEQSSYFKKSALVVCDCYTGEDNGSHIDALVSFLRRYG